MFSILIAHSDQLLCSRYTEYFREQSVKAHMVHDGREALEQVLAGGYSIVIAELLLPNLRGMDLLAAIRRQLDTPVFLISEQEDEIDRILALEMGADDCLLAPISARELFARAKATLRRVMTWEPNGSANMPASGTLQVGDITLNPASHSTTCTGKTLDLTAVEFTMLEILLRAAGHPVTREYLCTEALGRPFTAYDRSVDVHVSNLRRKLGKHADGSTRIHTIRGTGYLYAHQASNEDPIELGFNSGQERSKSTGGFALPHAAHLTA